jgi:multiple sugar transport system permease protein
VGLKWSNYSEALSFLPPETDSGLVYLKNTLILVIMSVVGTILSSSIVAYAFSRMRFPGRDVLFAILLSTMMLPGAVTLLPQFLIFRQLHWIDTLYPLWVPAFFASAFNVFLLRQFFKGIPMELEDAAKIDGCSYAKTFWSVMLPQIKPALAVIAIWTFMGAWNNFMGPLIYVNSPENMPLSYALQLFQGDRGGEPGLLMAFATMCMVPVLAVFFFAQRYFIEGVTLSGLGGR